MNTHPLHSDLLGGARRVWRLGEGPLCLFMDGEYYLDHVGARAAVEALGLSAAWVSYDSPASRHVDYTCSERYARFVTQELLPWLGEEIRVVAGLSLSGLAAAHLALEHPGRFPRAICQSPSAWWSEERLAEAVRARGGGPVPAWISVGDQEIESDLRHPPSDMYQGATQVDSCRRLAEAWGPSARFSIFEGGHDPACWARELPEALRWALRQA